MGALETFVNLGNNLFGNLYANKQNRLLNQENQQFEREMLNKSHVLNEESANLADARTRALYEDLQSPAAMREQYEKAGLSVGLMYGGGGAGGGNLQNGAQAQAASQTSTGRFAMRPLMDAGVLESAMNSALNEAQTANIAMDTAKKKAETANISAELPNIERTGLQIEAITNELNANVKKTEEETKNIVEMRANILEERGNIKASRELREAEKDYNEAMAKLFKTDNETRGELNRATINHLKAQAAEARANARKIGLEADFLNDTMKLRWCQLAWDLRSTSFKVNMEQPWNVQKTKAEIISIINGTAEDAQKNRFYQSLGPFGDFMRVLNTDIIQGIGGSFFMPIPLK